jgi:hypothetical protein
MMRAHLTVAVDLPDKFCGGCGERLTFDDNPKVAVPYFEVVPKPLPRPRDGYMHFHERCVPEYLVGESP